MALQPRLLLSVVVIVALALSACSVRSPVSESHKPTPAHLQAEAMFQNGTQAYQAGRLSEAARFLNIAEERYEQLGKKDDRIEVLLSLAKVQQALGDLDEALSSLQKAATLGLPDDPSALITHDLQMGNLYLARGDLDLAEKELKQAMTLAAENSLTPFQAAIANDLGNLHQARQDFEKAQAAYFRSFELSKNPARMSTALTNAARVAALSGDHSEAWDLAHQGIKHINALPESRLPSFLQVSLAETLLDFPSSEYGRKHFTLAESLLFQAAQRAEEMNDATTASQAWGALGRAAELQGRYDQALILTHKAVHEAQKASQAASLYRWQWQAGRVLHAQGKRTQAIAALRSSIWTLATIRGEISCTYAEPQRSFRKAASTICFQLVRLLLEEDTTRGGNNQNILREIRDLVELLKVYELREFFQDDCLDASRTRNVPLEAVCQSAVVIYPILLMDRTELLVSLPAGLKRFSVPIGRSRLTREINEFRFLLEKRTTREFMIQARRLYDWLIKPLEKDLVASQTNTLVFVPDGHLRTIPMGALYDGQRFLVEKFATAVTPGLDMTDPGPLRADQKCLAGGITQSTQGFPPIPHVDQELRYLASAFEHKLLMNEEFKASSLKTSLAKDDYSILHLASHGQFRDDINDSFILTYDSRLNINLLDSFIGFLRFRDRPLEHLTLSACETAAGNDRAALGLAGVAIKAGARSALATLWHINDQASATLITEFYRQLKQDQCSRGKALRLAKLKLLEDDQYAHPGYWSPFLLINNWL